MNRRRYDKIVLPTVETCRWRDVRDDGQAHCGVLRSLFRGNDIQDVVTPDQCAACCASFPPTPRKLNPVVASLLFQRVLDQRAAYRSDGSNDKHSIDDATAAWFEQTLTTARRALPRQHDGSILPLRATRGCCWLGPSLEQVSPRSDGDQPDRICHHPSYGRTNARQCARCCDWSVVRPIVRPLTLAEIVPPTSSALDTRNVIQHWAVGVTTAARIEPTLGACLDGLIRAGWEDVHLFLDGNVRVPSEHTHLPTTWREESVGAALSWMLAWCELVATRPTADAYVLFQDDAFVHYGDSLRQYLESALWPAGQESVVSLFNPGLCTEPGWHTLPTDWDWGAMAVVFPPGLLRAFLSDAIVWSRCLPTQLGEHRPIPELLREWLARHNLSAWTPFPSVVQHIGHTSSIWPYARLTGQRSAPFFSADIDHPFDENDRFDHFDEAAFPPDPSLAEAYAEQLQRGRDGMKSCSLVVCAVARNIRLSLPRTIQRLERLGRAFQDYSVVIAPVDSADATLELLQAWQRSSDHVHLLPTSDSQLPVVAIRNSYLDYVRDHFSHFTHVMVIDLDLYGGWSHDGIAHSFGHTGWDCIVSNGMEEMIQPPQKPSKRKSLVPPSMMRDVNAPYQRGEALIRGGSAFGGLAIYTMRSFLAGRYEPGETDEDAHVAFHRQLRSAGFTEQYLNPSQIVFKSVMIR